MADYTQSDYGLSDLIDPEQAIAKFARNQAIKLAGSLPAASRAAILSRGFADDLTPATVNPVDAGFNQINDYVHRAAAVAGKSGGYLLSNPEAEARAANPNDLSDYKAAPQAGSPITESGSLAPVGSTGISVPDPFAGGRHATSLAPAPPRVHAIKMPNGKILFTNTDEGDAQGQSVGYGAGTATQRQQASEDPADKVTKALIGWAMRASTPSYGQASGGAGLSMMQPLNGSAVRPSQLEDMANLSQIAKFQAERAYHVQESQMTPEQIAEMSDRNLATQKYRDRFFTVNRQHNLENFEKESAQAKALFPPGSKELSDALSEAKGRLEASEASLSAHEGKGAFSQAQANMLDSVYGSQGTR